MDGELQTMHGLQAAVIAAVVSTIGLVSMAMLGDWGRRNSPLFSAFAVGVLLVAVLFHVAPEALEHSMDAWQWMLAGAFGTAFIGLALRAFTRRRVEGDTLAFGFASIIAIATHSFIDGMLYETTFQNEDPFTGWLSTIGLLLHEFPEAVIAFFLLRETGMGVALAGVWAFVTASLTTIAGALATAYFLSFVVELPKAALLGLSAGALAYIVVGHLGPHARLAPGGAGYLTASVGIIIGVASIILRGLAGGH